MLELTLENLLYGEKTNLVVSQLHPLMNVDLLFQSDATKTTE